MNTMNMNGIYAANAAKEYASVSERSTSKEPDYEKGQILEGIVSKISDTVSINFDGKEMSFSKDAVQDAKEGQVRKFQIMDVSKNRIVLKEIGNDASHQKGGAMICTWVNSGKTFSEFLVQDMKEESEEEKQTSHSEQMTGQDYESLEEEGVLPEKLLLERLEQMVIRVKEQHAIKEQRLENQKEQFQEKTEQVRHSNISETKTGLEKQIAKQLEEANLPVTEENIEKIVAAVRQAEEFSNLRDSAIGYLLKNNLEPTIENIYKAVHSGQREKIVPFSEEVFESLKPAIVDRLKQDGMEANDHQLEVAKWLLTRELPVTTEQISAYEQLEKQKNSVSQEDRIAFAIRALKEGKSPEQANLLDTSEDKIKQAIEDFSKVSEKQLRYAAAKQWRQNHTAKELELTLDDFRNAQKELSAKPITEEIASVMNSAELDIITIHARRQLEEVRLKLTIESGHKLLEKGIQLDTEGLNRIVEGLKELEQEYYKNLMKEADLTSTEKATLLRQTIESVEELKNAPASLLGSTYVRRNEITVGTLAQEGKDSKAVLERAGEAYETLMTSPRSDLGDSIQKAFQNVDDILRDNGLELTEANKRAVRILGYNQMDLTKESIEGIKLYDTKVNQMFKNMQPSVTVEMIRRGKNPLELTVDEVNEIASEIKEELGVTEEIRFSNYLADLEQSHEISSKERESYIGIYRLLHQISKNDGEVIGSVVKAGQEMTLKNLLTASRVRNGNGIDARMKDAIERKEGSGFENGIDRQISTAFEEHQKEYAKLLAQQARESLTPNHLAQISKEMPEQMETMTLEALNETLSKKKEMKDPEHIKQYEERAQAIRNILKDSSDAIRFLNRYQIPNSIEMIAATKGLAENGGLAQAVRQVLSAGQFDSIESGEDLIESMQDAESLQREYEKFIEKLDNSIFKMLSSEDSTTQQRNELFGIRGQVLLAGSLAKQEYYEIPVQTEKGITNMNLKVVHRGMGGQATITLDTAHGLLRAEARIKDGVLECLITSETAAGLEFAKSLETKLKEEFAKEQLEVKEIYYGVDKNNIGTYLKMSDKISDTQTTQQTTDTSKLYHMAKAFITCLNSQN